MTRKWIDRLVRVAPAALFAAILALPASAGAQEVTEDYIVNQLGPAAEAMEAAGVDGSAESSPAIIDIAQRWYIEPGFWVSVEETQLLVRSAREDREVRTREASLKSPLDGYPSRNLVARFGVVRVALTCGQAQQKAHSAQRLADSLTRISQLNGIGTGLVGVISQGATRFVGPMAVATMVTGFAASWAGQLASAYRNAPCVTGGERWRFRPNVLRTSLSPDHSRVPLSLPSPRGWPYAASRTGTTSTPPAHGYPCRCQWVSGSWRWS
jgi:hypothetical protein